MCTICFCDTKGILLAGRQEYLTVGVGGEHATNAPVWSTDTKSYKLDIYSREQLALYEIDSSWMVSRNLGVLIFQFWVNALTLLRLL